MFCWQLAKVGFFVRPHDVIISTPFSFSNPWWWCWWFWWVLGSGRIVVIVCEGSRRWAVCYVNYPCEEEEEEEVVCTLVTVARRQELVAVVVVVGVPSSLGWLGPSSNDDEDDNDVRGGGRRWRTRSSGSRLSISSILIILLSTCETISTWVLLFSCSMM